MSAWTVIGVVVAGGFGAGLRYAVDTLVSAGRTGRFPLGVLVVNVTGSFALGLLTGLGAAVLGSWLAVLGVGLLGGYTTFSTVSVESVLQVQRRQVRRALLNTLGTLVLAAAAAGLGAAGGAALAVGY